MNYARHYQTLMDRAENRTVVGYFERHHVVPRCLDRESKHTVKLTPEEHYVAHQFLVKMHPGDYRLVFAAVKMTHIGKTRRTNNRMYGWLRREWNNSAGDAARAGWDKFRASVTPEEITRIRRDAALANMTPEKRARHSSASIANWKKRKSDLVADANARANQSAAQKKRYADKGSVKLGPQPKIAAANSRRVWTEESRGASAASRRAYYENLTPEKREKDRVRRCAVEKAKVARNASLTLEQRLQEAFDRLSKRVAKLEAQEAVRLVEGETA